MFSSTFAFFCLKCQKAKKSMYSHSALICSKITDWKGWKEPLGPHNKMLSFIDEEAEALKSGADLLKGTAKTGTRTPLSGHPAFCANAHWGLEVSTPASCRWSHSFFSERLFQQPLIQWFSACGPCSQQRQHHPELAGSVSSLNPPGDFSAG